jgi:hypothetical protein
MLAELWQDGKMVAVVECDDEETTKREIMHYAMVYAQDGPVDVRFGQDETVEQ